jgi:pSer/pThr/pTyr-binding forkhead associated (FHA) protein
MSELIFRVIDGADRGRVYRCESMPITIGREEGNSIQLNDERISRFHAKIQEDQSKWILTDLDSTNGTKVNGEDIQIRILRFGDIVTVGRSVLLFGSREQIAGRLRELRGAPNDVVEELKKSAALSDEFDGDSALDEEFKWSEDPDLRKTLHSLQPPDLPGGLSAGQTAQLFELLEYVHVALRDLIRSVLVKGTPERITLEMRQWQYLLDVQARLAAYLRQIGEPESPD